MDNGLCCACQQIVMRLYSVVIWGLLLISTLVATVFDSWTMLVICGVLCGIETLYLRGQIKKVRRNIVGSL